MKAICRLHALAVTTLDGRARAFAYGREYDLEESLGGLTLRELLGDYVTTGFEPVTPPAAAPVQSAAHEGETV